MDIPAITVPAGLDTRFFALGDGVVAALPQILQQQFPGRTPMIVADDNTWQAAGKVAQQYLIDAGMAPLEPHIFPGTPRLHPDYKYSQMLAEKFPPSAVPVAVGSGVINDIVKVAAGIAKMEYCCLPTACSVDGYTSAGGAMSVEGSKKTVPCPAPAAIVADPQILRSAPAEMFAAGYADLLTKVVAGADWIIADIIGEHPIRQDVWHFIHDKLPQWVSAPPQMAAVFEGLAATGYSMQMMNDSRPASGAEHLLSHVWEMEGLSFNGEDVSHGFKVGVGLMATSRLQKFILQHSYQELEPYMAAPLTTAQREAEVQQLLQKGCYGENAHATAMKKFLPPEEMLRRRQQIREAWPKLQAGIQKQLAQYGDLEQLLQKANCPTRPAEIGLDNEQFIHGVITAQLIRIRYTVLDLLQELGLLQYSLQSLDDMIRQ